MKTRPRFRGPRGSDITPPSLALALGYASVPANGDSSELRSQLGEIARACPPLGLRLVDVVSDGRSTNGAAAGRPALEQALERLEAGEVSCLVICRLEHLSRRVDELASLIDRLERAGARLVSLDVGLDTATSTGRLALERRPVTRPGQAVYATQSAEPAASDAARELPAASEPAPTLPAAYEPAEEPPTETAPAATPAAVATRALGYATLRAQAGGEHDQLAEQVEAIERRCADLGIDLVEIIHERQVEGRALDRPGLSRLLERIAARHASCVIVSALDQLSHSAAELGTIMDWLGQNKIRLIAIDLDLDTASSGGRLTAKALASVGSWEHDRLSERTREGLAAARAKRRAAAQAAGPGSSAPAWSNISERIAAMRADGMTLQAIADVLNAEGVPTTRGGAEWRPSSVQTAAGYKRRSRAKKPRDLPTVKRPPDSSSSQNPR
jgi:DNA invertase Pin-like site-specific DNA recombinase